MSVPSLAELRLAIGRKGIPLKQRELAELADKDPSYISHIEAGKMLPSYYLQVRLAEIFGVTIEQLRVYLRETQRRQRLGENQIRIPS